MHGQIQDQLGTLKKSDEMRNVEVQLDFTPNALASVLYRQGDTVILVAVPKNLNFHVGFLEMQQKAGFMQNTHSSRFNRFQVPQRTKRSKRSHAGN